jgi:hypothetical protein
MAMTALILWLSLLLFSPAEFVQEGTPQEWVEVLLRDTGGCAIGFPKEGITMVYYFNWRIIVLYDEKGRSLARPAPFPRRPGE